MLHKKNTFSHDDMAVASGFSCLMCMYLSLVDTRYIEFLYPMQALLKFHLVGATEAHMECCKPYVLSIWTTPFVFHLLNMLFWLHMAKLQTRALLHAQTVNVVFYFWPCLGRRNVLKLLWAHARAAVSGHLLLGHK